MVEVMKNLQQWWNQTNPRERLFVVGGGSVAGLILGYSFLWAPLTAKVDKVKADLVYKQKLLAWMQTNVPKLQQLRQAAPNQTNDTPVSSTVERELKSGYLAGFTSTLKQVNQNQVQVSFDSVPFDDSLRWLGQLSQRHGIRTDAIVAVKTDNVGMVRLSMTLAK